MNQTQTRSPRKRWLSLLLAVVLVVGLLPISAFASNVGTQADDSGTTAGSQEFLRIFHLDCGRKYFSVSEIEGIIDQLAANHYTHIQLAFGNDGLRFLLNDMSVTVNGTEYKSDAVKTAIQDGNSGNGLAGAAAGVLTQGKMDTILDYAKKAGIEVIPMFNAPGHMYTAIKAMNSLGIGGKYSGDSDASQPTKALNWSIDPTDSTSVAYAKALLTKYVEYFAEKGCTMFNVGADESGLSSSNYAAYAEMVNAMNEIVKSKGMTTLAYNDGIYNTTYASSQSNVTFKNDIVICYWTTGGGIASARSLSAKGFKILNNTNNWYYVLGDGLYRWDVWGSNGQWGYDSAVAGLGSTKVTQVNGDEDTKAVTPIGSVLCCWCDVPSIGYTEKGIKATNQTNQESVYKLIEAMAKANPGYFKETKPELSVGDAQGVTVSATKGNYQVILPEDTEGATLTVQLSMKNLADGQTAVWSSDKEEIATVDANTGLVTFIGGPGTVTITARPQSSTNADEATAYTVTFEVKAAGELAVKEITVQEGRTYDVTLNGDWVVAVKNLSNGYVKVDAVYNQTAEMELQAVTGIDEIVSGERYLIVNQRTKTTLTNVSGTSEQYTGLQLSGTASINSTDIWEITKNDSYYKAQYADSNNYLTIDNETSSVGSSSSALTLSYSEKDGIDGVTGGYWNISSSGYYLNNLGNGTSAGGWNGNGASADAGSKWTLYRIVEKTAADTTTITFTGLQVGTTFVTIGDTTYRITVTEKKLVEIPITIIDYRADGLLFDYSYADSTYGEYPDSYRYSLVHGRAEQTSINSSTNVAGTWDSSAGIYYVDGNGSKVESIPGTRIEQTGPAVSYGNAFYTNSGDNSWSRAGLVETKLGTNGMPVYTDAAVQYVAGLLAAGYWNGEVAASGYSCNTELKDTFLTEGKERCVLNSTVPTKCSDAFEKTRSYSSISNAYDLAWYLLNTLYQPDTNMTTVNGTDGSSYQVPLYGMAVDTYKSIVLTDGGNGKYTFEAGYKSNGVEYPQNVNFDRENGKIYNGGDEQNLGFYPLDELGYEQPGLLKNTSKIDARHNGSFTLRGESQFVYNEDDDLYFTFTGDDDVYMYINGVLALDLGGAHGRNTKTVNLNELDKTKYGLAEDQVATFTFFYMERCSDASTFGIETNMELVQREISVQKNAYRDSQYTENSKVNSGEAVSNDSTLYYDLVVSNEGNTSMTNISISDTDSFGGSAYLGADQIAAVAAGSKMEVGLVSLGEQGYTYFIVDKDGIKGADEKCSTLEQLSKAVAGLTLEGGAQLHIRFLTAKVNVAESKIISYTNTLNVTAVSGDKELSDSAIHTIYSYNAGGTDKTYVVDFGLPLKITGIFDDTAEKYIDKNTNAIKLNGHPKYGDVTEFESKGMETSMVYKLKTNTTIDGQDTITLNVPYKFGNTSANLDKNIYIIPASNVYYEDNLATFTDGAGVAEDAKWSNVNNEDKTTAEVGGTDVYQALQELGNSGVYGYDTAYNSSSMLSMGTAHKVTVKSAMADPKTWNDEKDAWPTASFTFTGTGFDVISLTNNKSGAIFVDVYAGSKAEGKAEKKYVVNNYYGYTYDEESKTWQVDPDGNNALYQIPVMKITDLAYGEHTVVIKVAYNEYLDTANKHEYSFWLDAIRVYNPMGDEYADYTKDNEGYPQYIKLRDELAKTADASGDKKVVFIDGAASATIAQYANYGPNNEVYLAKGQAISFKLTGDTSEIASIQIGAKAPDGKPASMVVNSDENNAVPLETATEMYYTISSGDGQFTIANKGEGILSLTNLKITYKTSEKTVTLSDLTAKEQANAVAMVQALFAAPVETFQAERFEVSWGGSVRAGRKATLTVKASEDVDAITVDGVTVSSYTTRTERTGWGWWSPKVTYRVFTYTITATATADYQVCAVNSAGISSEPVIATLTVRPATWWNWWF